MESGFLHWGHDISTEENQYQAGLSFAISKSKSIDFIGKKALEKIKKDRIKSRFLMFTLENSKSPKPTSNKTSNKSFKFINPQKFTLNTKLI